MGNRKWEDPEFQSLSWASSTPSEACKHSQLRDAQGHDWRSNPLTPLLPPHPPSFPHAVTLIETFLTTGKSFLNEKQKQKNKQKENTQKPEKDKQALSYVQEKPTSRRRQKQQLCHGKEVFFTTLETQSLCWASSSQQVSGGLCAQQLCSKRTKTKNITKTNWFQFSLWLRPPNFCKTSSTKISQCFVQRLGNKVVKKKRWNKKREPENEKFLNRSRSTTTATFSKLKPQQWCNYVLFF